jgi:hypothetical protein
MNSRKRDGVSDMEAPASKKVIKCIFMVHRFSIYLGISRQKKLKIIFVKVSEKK